MLESHMLNVALTFPTKFGTQNTEIIVAVLLAFLPGCVIMYICVLMCLIELFKYFINNFKCFCDIWHILIIFCDILMFITLETIFWGKGSWEEFLRRNEKFLRREPLCCCCHQVHSCFIATQNQRFRCCDGLRCCQCTSVVSYNHRNGIPLANFSPQPHQQNYLAHLTDRSYQEFRHLYPQASLMCMEGREIRNTPLTHAAIYIKSYTQEWETHHRDSNPHSETIFQTWDPCQEIKGLPCTRVFLNQNKTVAEYTCSVAGCWDPGVRLHLSLPLSL